MSFFWCRRCKVAWDEDSAERISLEEFISRDPPGWTLPVRDCTQSHGYSVGNRVPVAFCKECGNPLVLVQNPDGSFSLPPHEEDGDGCPGSNVLTHVLMLRDPKDLEQETNA